ncbi:hypothetical protein BT63DRAFT_316582 [Microthyrium microscopicum]|uniref:SET domain-containing protein n=1 Tax=Microthyrium microscopicum TaxID=703497 RepID=A0A6A6U365_9PEZI|nr:hypothetical protein BT63DRAFT_316582 [Microthyrium microscopicum]
MDQIWDLERYYPTSPEATYSDQTTDFARYQRLQQLLLDGQALSVGLSERPRDATLWLKRGIVLLELGILELAMGDLYKCQLLCDSRLYSNETSTYTNINDPITQTQDNPEFDDQQEQVSALKLMSSLMMLEALQKTHCFQDAIDLASQMVEVFPQTVEFQIHRDTAKESLRRFLSLHGSLKGSSAMIPHLFGEILRKPYPWMSGEYLRRPKQFIPRMNGEIRSTSSQAEPTSALEASHWDDSSVEEVSMFAVRNIQKGELIIKDVQMIAVCEGSSMSLCNYCFDRVSSRKKFIAKGSQATYCSKQCLKAAITMNTHTSRPSERLLSFCAKDMSHFFPPIQLLPRLLASCIDSLANGDIHPLLHPVISRWKADFRISNGVRFPFSFKTHIQRPISILQELGVDIFRASQFDTWVIINILNRIGANMISRPAQLQSKPQVSQMRKSNRPNPRQSKHPIIHSLGFIQPLFNHSCNPSVLIEPDHGGIVFRARRHISKGEELSVSYVDLDTLQHGSHALLQWFDKCLCTVCEERSR